MGLGVSFRFTIGFLTTLFALFAVPRFTYELSAYHNISEIARYGLCGVSHLGPR